MRFRNCRKNVFIKTMFAIALLISMLLAAEAIAGDERFFVLPEGTKRVEAQAFKDNIAITAVEFPAGIESIDDTAFDGCVNLTTVYGVADTCAETWAAKQGFAFIDVNAPEPLPESKHPYDENCDEEWVIRRDDNTYLLITFSEQTMTESGFDYIYIYDGHNKLIGKYTGNELAGKSIAVESSVCRIRLTSDEVDNKYGFAVTNVTTCTSDTFLVNVTPNGYSCKPNEYVTWTVDTCFAQGECTYSYRLLCDGETIYQSPERLHLATITKRLTQEGHYTLQVTATDESGKQSTCTSEAVWCTTAPEAGYRYELYEDESEGTCAVITGYNGVCVENLELPDTILGHPVKKIGASAFYKRIDLEGTLVLPEGLTGIGDYAFEDCGFSGTLVLPDGLTEIGDHAFAYCDFSGTLDLPDGLIELGEGAFRDCGFTGGLTIPKGITVIRNGAFASCRWLDGELHLPDEVTGIEYAAFAGCGFTGSLVLPKGLTYMGGSAFGSCSGFTGDLILPDDLSVIEMECFKGCFGFDGNLILPTNLTCIQDYAFSDCSNLSGCLTIPDTLISIGIGAFCYCDKISEIVVSDSFFILGSTTSITSLPSNALIVCEIGSIAQKYAMDLGYGYRAGDYIFRPSTLSGKVTTNDGQPLSGATVCLYQNGKQVATETTFYSGEYTFYKLGLNDNYTLTCQKPGYTFDQNPLAVKITSQSTTAPTIVGTTDTQNKEPRIIWPSGTIYEYTCDAVFRLNPNATSNTLSLWNTDDGQILLDSQTLTGATYRLSLNPGVHYRLRVVSVVNGQSYSAEGTFNVPPTDDLPHMVSAAASTDTVATGVPVLFNLRALNADRIQIIVDDVAYDTTLCDEAGQATMRRAFTQSGIRSVQFVALRGGLQSERSNAITLNVTSVGALAAPVIHSVDTVEPGDTLTVLWDEVENATMYGLYLYKPNGEVVHSYVQEASHTFSADDLSVEGHYALNVLSCGEGYSQSQGSVEFDVALVYHEWTGYLQRSTASTYESPTATSPNGFVDYIDPVIVLGEEGDFYYIEMRLTSGDTARRYVHRNMIGSEPWKPDVTCILTATPCIALTGETVTLTAVTNIEGERVEFTCSDGMSSTDENGITSGYKRTFTGQMIASRDGQTTYTATAYGSSNRSSTKSVTVITMPGLLSGSRICYAAKQDMPLYSDMGITLVNTLDIDTPLYEIGQWQGYSVVTLGDGATLRYIVAQNDIRSSPSVTPTVSPTATGTLEPTPTVSPTATVAPDKCLVAYYHGAVFSSSDTSIECKSDGTVWVDTYCAVCGYVHSGPIPDTPYIVNPFTHSKVLWFNPTYTYYYNVRQPTCWRKLKVQGNLCINTPTAKEFDQIAVEVDGDVVISSKISGVKSLVCEKLTIDADSQITSIEANEVIINAALTGVKKISCTKLTIGSNGVLGANNAVVSVHGDFSFNSSRSHTEYLKGGELNVEGSIRVASNTFICKDGHMTYLTGYNQYVKIDNSSAQTSHFCNLTLKRKPYQTLNSSSQFYTEGVFGFEKIEAPREMPREEEITAAYKKQSANLGGNKTSVSLQGQITVLNGGREQKALVEKGLAMLIEKGTSVWQDSASLSRFGLTVSFSRENSWVEWDNYRLELNDIVGMTITSETDDRKISIQAGELYRDDRLYLTFYWTPTRGEVYKAAEVLKDVGIENAQKAIEDAYMECIKEMRSAVQLIPDRWWFMSNALVRINCVTNVGAKTVNYVLNSGGVTSLNTIDFTKSLYNDLEEIDTLSKRYNEAVMRANEFIAGR